MRYILLLLIISFGCSPVFAENRAMKDMCNRLFPEHSGNFTFELAPDSLENDFFTIESINDKIKISGNNNNSLATGLNHYLKYYCHTHVSWYATDKIEMPRQLPVLLDKITIFAKCKTRFFLNYCTFGYSMPYWKWKDWERLIDWMALNGVNTPLAITGQEAIWYDVWKEMGLKDQEIRSYFTGPAHLPWHRMSNVDYWQSPLPLSWLKNQRKLQKQIVDRERLLGMTPVLPAFSGHVPAELKRLYPDAAITQMSQWGGYDEKYRSHFIDPMDPLFGKIQKRYLEKQTKLYGTDHIYGIDPFNEVDSPNWDEDFLRTVSDKIFHSIEQVDSLAHWIQMTWMFYHSKDKWSQPRIKAFLNSVPDDKLILLDYYCDSVEIWRETQQYYGKPYIWCYLGNFGGNSMLAGHVDDVSAKLNRLFVEGGKNISGVGATLEGLDVNPFMYEFVLEKAWSHTITNADWMKNWALCRGGSKSSHIIDAWQQLYKKIYIHHATAGQAVLMNARPMLEGTDSWNTHPDIYYDNKELWHIWGKFLEAKNVDSSGYKFDVINNGDGIVDTDDYVAIGRTAIPEINYGFGANISYKDFDVAFFFQGIGNVTGFIGGETIDMSDTNQLFSNVYQDVALNYWRPDRPNAKYPRLAISGSENNKAPSTHNQVDKSFMRLKSAEIGYTLPKEVCHKMGISLVRFYVSGTNLLTFSKFKLWDPEIDNSQGSSYPNMRVFNIGLNFNF